VKNNPSQFRVPDRQPEIKEVLLEAVLVAVIGAAFAFAANGISPLGLKLARNYFPTMTRRSAPSAVQLLSARLKEKGVQVLDGQQAARLFQDPRCQQEMIVFIDARDARHYEEGHVPGAYLFDPYRQEKYLATVLPVCQVAEQIVVYCNGGDCEDSEFAAEALRDAGVANQKLFVYTGGITEWTTNSLPVETGARKSGNLRNASK
jgi:rhodanese-related sulfurtransferase